MDNNLHQHSADPLENECRSLIEQITSAQNAGKSLVSYGKQCLELGERAFREGRSELTVTLLSHLQDVDIPLPRFYFLLALAQHDEQDIEAARAAIVKAAALAPQDADIAFANAQITYENWRPAAHLFRSAQRLAPENLSLTINAAAALYAEEKSDTAIKILTQAAHAHPDWVEGHQALSKYHLLCGNRDSFDDGFRKACSARPRNLALRMAWFQILAQEKEWARAETVVHEGESEAGRHGAFELARAFIASETDNVEEARRRFQSLSTINDPSFDLCQVRFYLRHNEIERAIHIAEQRIGKDSAASFWPYLSLAWRLAEDSRSEWLDRDGAFIRSYDLEVTDSMLADLTSTLRELHLSKSPYLEQSVRGGTQTDRNLFFNTSPHIQEIRKFITDAARAYIDSLPVHDGDHPLLSRRRDRIRYDGCWSIRLQSKGFHVSHVHPAGWISSAFYVSLPLESDMGARPAGWISFGEPPPELAIDLAPFKQIKPEPGRLVLFPSTMWHRTIPFEDGERMTIAFDVADPGA